MALVRRIDELQQRLAEAENRNHLLEAQVNQQAQVEAAMHQQVDSLRSGKRGVAYTIGIKAATPDEATMMLARLQREPI